ncbi:hypothetical protein RMCBS344292_16877 [Rhizopus microsporus]|nr:hypothetical protein RMCBS344292_16877 [Rhizopus microsporus]
MVNNDSEESYKKKQKVHHDEQKERGLDFYDKLIFFLADEESDTYFYKYSPENNGMLKLTNEPKPRLPMSTSILQLKSFIETLLYNV